MQTGDTQLSALRSVVSLLDDVEIDFWLAGGWAVDFHYGEVTRSHSDIDLVVYHADKRRVHRALNADGFVVIDDSDPDAEVIYGKGDLKVDLSFVTVRADGTTVSPGWEHWPWPANSFTEEEAHLSAIALRVISAQTLLVSKTDYELNTGEAPRPQDLADIETLQRTLQRSRRDRD